MACDMCGADVSVKIGLVEGVEMKVCSECASFANKMIEPQRTRPQYSNNNTWEKPKPKEYAVIAHYARIIQKALNKLDKKNEDIAKELNIKDSVLSHFATGKRKPSLEMAKKLERYFKIRLVIEVHEETYKKNEENAPSGPLTLGDLMKKKK